jgi:hypothetical protein
MDNRNYIFMKMEESFGTTYYISDIENGQITQNNTLNQTHEQFNSLDKKCVDNVVNDYNFTFRQIKPNMS